MERICLIFLGKDFPVNTPIELTDVHLDSHISWYNNPDSKIENVISEIQIEKGNAVTSYEPYHEPQSLSIQTPTGLPAIPVDTDGNYTDANGQQWIADYVDLKRGKRINMVGEVDLGLLDWTYMTNYTAFSAKVSGKADGQNMLCSTYINYGQAFLNNMPDMHICANNRGNQVFAKNSKYTDADAFKQAMPGSMLYYKLATPEEIDLTDEEVQALKALVTYAGTTIVENDADCYMEVSAGGGDALRAKKLALLLGD